MPLQELVEIQEQTVDKSNDRETLLQYAALKLPITHILLYAYFIWIECLTGDNNCVRINIKKLSYNSLFFRDIYSQL